MNIFIYNDAFHISYYEGTISKRCNIFLIKDILPFILIYSVLVFLSFTKALYHLESDNLLRITLVVAD